MNGNNELKFLLNSIAPLKLIPNRSQINFISDVIFHFHRITYLIYYLFYLIHLIERHSNKGKSFSIECFSLRYAERSPPRRIYIHWHCNGLDIDSVRPNRHGDKHIELIQMPVPNRICKENRVIMFADDERASGYFIFLIRSNRSI